MPTLEELNALKSRQLPATDYDNLDSELSYPYSPSINVTGITFSTPIKLGGYFPEFFEDTDPLSPIKEQPPSDYQTMGEALTTLTLTKPKQNTCAKQLMFVNRQSKTNQTKPFQKQTIEVEKYKPKVTIQGKSSTVWIQNDIFTLRQHEKEIMYSTTAWLCDTVIDAAQKILKESVPAKNGFQSVCLGRTCAFQIETSEFVQILHNGHDHWITISTFGADEGEVFVYDSLYCSVSSSVKAQIACLLATKKEKIELKFIDVQMQSGKYDCGLFAVAFATALVHGQQPGKFMFDQQAMRKHLRLCLQNKVMPMFPIKKTRRVMAKVKSVDYIEIYCTCRMPPIPDVEMIECTKCKSWFHFPMCVSIPPEARKRGAQWFCDNCRISQY